MPASSASRPAPPEDDAAPQTIPPQPLKPRPKLLAAISIVFAAWVLFLVVLYYQTVYPRRSTAPRPDASGAVLKQERDKTPP